VLGLWDEDEDGDGDGDNIYVFGEVAWGILVAMVWDSGRVEIGYSS
jgi:hypothetical protein